MSNEFKSVLNRLPIPAVNIVQQNRKDTEANVKAICPGVNMMNQSFSSFNVKPVVPIQFQEISSVLYNVNKTRNNCEIVTIAQSHILE